MPVLRAFVTSCQRIMGARSILVARLRSTLQSVFFILFVLLLAHTKLPGSSSSRERLVQAANVFFRLDSLVALVNLLAGHAFCFALLWSLVS